VGPAANAEALHRLIGTLGTGPVIVVGHSYGAAVAVRLAGLHPDSVRGLVLVCPAVNRAALDRTDRMLATPIVGEAMTYLVMRGLSNAAHWGGRLLPNRYLSDLPVRLGLPADRVNAFTEHWRTGDLWRVFSIEQRALLEEMPAVESGLGALSVPVRVLAGRRDRVIPSAVVEKLSAQIPGVEITWVPDAGHLLAWRRPELVAGAVKALTGVGGQGRLGG
jgi:pimeloyl-ACP methyl ester carboxylesterase